LVHNENYKLILSEVHVLTITPLCQKLLFICSSLACNNLALQYLCFCNSSDIKVSLLLQLKDDVLF